MTDGQRLDTTINSQGQTIPVGKEILQNIIYQEEIRPAVPWYRAITRPLRIKSNIKAYLSQLASLDQNILFLWG